jgi:hypothetical protein
MKKIARIFFDPKFTPIVLFILTVISYGLFAPFTGLYMDDWYILWFKHVFGALQFPSYFALDRPLMGYFFTACSTLLGSSESPMVWQIFAIMLRWLVAYSLWGMLNSIWPNSKRQNTWVALLAVVFPGFTQQWFAVVYSFFFACLAGFFLSINLMVRALNERKYFWLKYLLSILLMAYCVPASEFYFGIELVRVVILWIVISRNESAFGRRTLETLKYWAAYLLVFVLFAIWRAFFFVSVNHEVSIMDQLKAAPVSVLIESMRKVYQAGIDALINAWGNAFNIQNYPAKGVVGVLILLVSASVLVALFFWVKNTTLKLNSDEKVTDNWTKEAFWVGLISIILAVLPFWAAGLQIDYLYPYDRFMLAYLMGSCLLLVVLLEFLGKDPKRSMLVLVALVSVAVAYQIANANTYKNLWTQQKNLYWQLNWRIPYLKSGSTLLSWDVPNGDYYSGHALSAQINWTYADEIKNREVPYEFILMSRGQDQSLPALQANTPFETIFRTYTFAGNTSNTLYIAYDGQGCLRVLDSSLTPPLTVLADYNKDILDASELSNLGLIEPEGINNPPLQVLGNEPSPTWCYYFEKAELARQYSQYDTVIDLLNQAEAKGFHPLVLTEWYPFIDSYLHLQNFDLAKELSQKALAKQGKIEEIGVCNLWLNYQDSLTDATAMSKLNQNLVEFHCK